MATAATCTALDPEAEALEQKHTTEGRRARQIALLEGWGETLDEVLCGYGNFFPAVQLSDSSSGMQRQTTGLLGVAVMPIVPGALARHHMEAHEDDTHAEGEDDDGEDMDKDLTRLRARLFPWLTISWERFGSYWIIGIVP